MNAYQEIYEQYYIEASLLWMLRSIAVEQPHNTVQNIQEIEQRIEAHLDGLMASIDQTWQICLEGLEVGEPGEIFTSAIIAFKSHDKNKIEKAVGVGIDSPQAFPGLVSAMGWLPGKIINPWIKTFFTSKDLNHKYLALAACSVRRKNPADYLNNILQRDDCKKHIKLYARALRLIGELRRLDLMPYVNEALDSEQKDIRFWANWSAILLGNRAVVKNLEPYVFKKGEHQLNAINLAFRVLPVDQARNWITRLAADPEQSRIVIKATGILGDPHAVNWLISKMQDSAEARLAGEAFTLITGIDLEDNNLVAGTAPAIAQQPNDETDDEDISMDEDENLEWPDPDKLSSIWMNRAKHFIDGQRYFMGQAITPEVLKEKIRTAYQRQRHAAALELALSSHPVPLQNTRAKVLD